MVSALGKEVKTFPLGSDFVNGERIWKLEFQLAVYMTTGERFCINNQKP